MPACTRPSGCESTATALGSSSRAWHDGPVRQRMAPARAIWLDEERDKLIASPDPTNAACCASRNALMEPAAIEISIISLFRVTAMAPVLQRRSGHPWGTAGRRETSKNWNIIEVRAILSMADYHDERQEQVSFNKAASSGSSSMS